MKKEYCLILILFSSFISLYSQNYYEVPYVGKRSVLTKLNESDKNLFIKQNNIKTVFEIPSNGEKDHYGFFNESENEYLVDHDIYAELMDCYKEDIPDENGKYVLSVYRIMYDFKETTRFNLTPNDNTERKCIGQIIYVPNVDKYVQYEKYIYFGDQRYKYLNMTQGVEARNIQFRICNDNIFAFTTRICYMKFTRGYDEETLSDGSDRFTENIICRTKLNSLMDKTKICEVKVDFPLLDKNNPFKYSVQNAFDGDPTTSYVENSENDLFEINIDFMNFSGKEKNEIIDEIKLINGYAANNELYKQNNRIFGIQYDWKDESIPIIYECNDNKLNFQKIPQFNSSPGWLWFDVISIYKGNKYSDTSLSELDFRFRESGWFFKGDIVESN